jgi:NAD(P)-dependent dehydrogenase (short-subunit alcohol dehydrogenase family)
VSYAAMLPAPVIGACANISPDMADPIRSATSLQQLRQLSTTFPADSAMGTAPPGIGGYAPTYAVSKCLLNRAVQLLSGGAPELGGEGLSVVTVCPGWCRWGGGGGARRREGVRGGLHRRLL